MAFASAVSPTAAFVRAQPAGRRAGGVVRAAAAVAAPAPAPAARTHYEVLGVRAGASRGEIKAAYRQRAREVHPDAGGSAGAGAEEFIRLHNAYATLADPDARAQYDRAMVGPPLWRAAASPMFRRRTWETDQCW